MIFKHQGSILYLLGYLVYISNRQSQEKTSIWLICLALVFFGVSLIASFSQQGTKDMSAIRGKKQLETFAESAGSLLTLLFALAFIPKTHFLETHLALFGLLILTFLATGNILPGVSETNFEPENSSPDHHSAVDLPSNRY